MFLKGLHVPHLNVPLICTIKALGSVYESCVVCPLCYRRDNSGLFTHLHTGNVDLAAWPAGDSQLRDSHPAAHTVLEATHERPLDFSL